MTHAHEISLRACEIFVDYARELLKTGSKTDALKKISGKAAPYDRLASLAELPESEINSSGYVVDALESAIWCFINTEDYTECVLKAIDLGGDTDTIAAIAGALAGMHYGIGSIPESWINSLCRLDYITELSEAFEKAMGID